MKTPFLNQNGSGDSLSNEELCLQVKRGNISAFDLLYERHKRGLFQFILRYLKNAAEAEEVFHDAFLQCLDSREVDFASGSFQGWLYQIARNLCLNRLRSKKRFNHTVAELTKVGLLTEAPPPIDFQSAEAQLIHYNQNVRYQKAIQNLPDHLDSVLKLRLSGLAHQEIAQALNIPIGTVKYRFHTLVTHLKNSLANITDSEVP